MAPRPAPTIKWHDMNATILRKQKETMDTSVKSKIMTSPQPHPSSINADDSNTGLSGNGCFDSLDQPLPDLTGVEGRAFIVTLHIDLQVPALLDVLADKSTHHTSRKGVCIAACHPRNGTNGSRMGEVVAFE
jgi:hypothetical protein